LVFDCTLQVLKIVQPWQWSLGIVICLYIASLEQSLNLVTGVQSLFFACVCRSGAIVRPCRWSPVLVICLYFAGLEQSPDPVSGVLRRLLACISQVWNNPSTLPVESSDCYSFVFCRSGAIVRPCRRGLVLAICLYFRGLEELFDPVSGVAIVICCILPVLFDSVSGVW
jgi:hypothetical protein